MLTLAAVVVCTLLTTLVSGPKPLRNSDHLYMLMWPVPELSVDQAPAIGVISRRPCHASRSSGCMDERGAK